MTVDTANRNKVHDWLTARALPLWSGIGVDRECGGFIERLTWSGKADTAVTKRVRVQARQIYVFAHAAVLGLDPNGAEVAAQGYDFLLRHACPDGAENGFVHSLSRNGDVVDARRDSYDHAFLLFAFSWFYRATGRSDVLRVINAVMGAIDARLALPSGAGVAIDDARDPERSQNPQMHLFEALLAAAHATGEARFLDRADDFAVLFRDRMFDPRLGVLREFYDVDWRPAPGEAGRIVEPGHHCEWIWLLKRHADAHRRLICDEAWQLAEFVERHGRPGGGVLLCDTVWTDGSVRSANTRSWPQTEALKAEIALAEARGGPLAPRADAIVDALFDRFLDHPKAGGWIDWTDSNGAPLVDAVPASTLYHLFLAFVEYLGAGDAG